jgi:hypothetical protein
VQDVTIDINEIATVGTLTDPMKIPDLVEQSFCHGLSSPVSTAAARTGAIRLRPKIWQGVSMDARTGRAHGGGEKVERGEIDWRLKAAGG